MKNIQTFEDFIKQDFIDEGIDLDIIDMIIESEIEEELKNLIHDPESLNELKELMSELEYFNSILDENPQFLFEDSDSETQSDLEYAKAKGSRSTTKKVANAIGWLAFPYISILRYVYKTVAKKIAIRRIIKKENDPIKKEKLRGQLKEMTRKQVKGYEDLKKMKEKAAEKKEELKNSDKVKEIPAAKKEALVKQAEKQKEEAKKLRDDIEAEQKKAA